MSLPHESPEPAPEGATRRTFLAGAAAAVAAAPLAPLFLHASDKAGTDAPRVGSGEHTYEVQHGWGEVPDHVVWGETHGVAVDGEGLVYVKHRSTTAEPMDAIVVFDPEGKFVRSFGREYHTGGHGIDLRREGNEEFLYLSDIAHGVVAKTNLLGEPVWVKRRLTETGKYDDPAARYSPTNVCFRPEGGFYIADGYGSHWIHQYDADAKWVRTFGGPGNGAGQLSTPHGLWLDNRPGREPSLLVCDRANARLQYFTLDGEHLGFVNEVSFPAHIDIRGDVVLCPDLHARVTLFDKDNRVLAHLGHDPEWTKQVLDGFKLRGQPDRWQAGKFIHPHDACFDAAGNIFVVEWVPTGRVSLLRKVG